MKKTIILSTAALMISMTATPVISSALSGDGEENTRLQKIYNKLCVKYGDPNSLDSSFLTNEELKEHNWAMNAKRAAVMAGILDERGISAETWSAGSNATVAVTGSESTAQVALPFSDEVMDLVAQHVRTGQTPEKALDDLGAMRLVCKQFSRTGEKSFLDAKEHCIKTRPHGMVMVRPLCGNGLAFEFTHDEDKKYVLKNYSGYEPNLKLRSTFPVTDQTFTVACLKQLINYAEGIPIDLITLVFNGRAAQDDEALSPGGTYNRAINFRTPKDL